MTALIGSSLFLVVASAVVLAMGWSTANESLIWTSIAASAGAGLCLIAAVLIGKRRTPRAESTRPVEARATATELRRPARPEPTAGATAGAMPPTDVVDVPSPGEAEPAAAPAPSKRKTAAKPAVAAEEVIAVPDRKKFHRPECRYAGAKGAEKMSKASARRRGYAACGVCKP